MDIKSKFKLILLLPVILLAGFQCSDNTMKIADIPESAFIDNCPDRLFEFGEMVSVGDPNNKFLVSLPYSWDIRESYNDSLYGVFASNFLSIPKAPEDKMAVSVTGYTSDKDLDQYFHDELIELMKDEQTSVMERGVTMVDGEKTPWVLFEIMDNVYTMVYYVKSRENNDIFLIQALSYDTVNYKTNMCYLKQLINSFEQVRD